ncbi:hypothetical protein WICPIJ_007646 [Wickerhamomyces pijperi]|uniref:Uncharacterized protein n=1 Tax=Wickerhamomyces pijperi TaxID=599730 RepID=A0A9P8PZC5_WICPI|nr:hypothetical protein WICPIJ_007646 [Wickerhamomyces pijperi]
MAVQNKRARCWITKLPSFVGRVKLHQRWRDESTQHVPNEHFTETKQSITVSLSGHDNIGRNSGWTSGSDQQTNQNPIINMPIVSGFDSTDQPKHDGTGNQERNSQNC